MIDLKKNIWGAVALVAALQLAVLTYMVWKRVSLLKHGREITVDVVPVDPRDIFRGDYVILGYPFSSTSGNGSADVPLPEGAHMNSAAYVTLAPGEGGTWTSARIELAHPGTLDPANVVLKGRVDTVWPGTDGKINGRIRYGIESYFVPEGTGVELEKLVRDKKIRAVLAIASDGTAAIKALEVDGKRIHEQAPL